MNRLAAANNRRTAVLVLAALLAALVVWLPLPFASVLPWAHSVLHVTAFLLLTIAAVTAPRLGWLRTAAVPAAALAAVALLGAAQAVSWPVAIVRELSPPHAALAESARALAGEPAAASVPLSLAPESSRDAALTWGAIAACLLLGASVGISRTARRALGGALLATALFEVLFGASLLAGRQSILWGLLMPGSASRLRGTFVNADHFATYLELALPVAFAWGWWAWLHAREEPSPDRRLVMLAPPVLVWLTLFVGVAFSGSRAGLIAAGTGVVVQGLLLAAVQRRWHVGAAGVLILAVGLGTAAAVGLQQGFGRLLGTSQYELTWNDRLAMLGGSLELWQRFPWLGTGLGTLRDAFPLVAPEAVAAGGWLGHAHNDYAEALVTVGVAGALILLVGAVGLLRGLTRSLRGGLRSEDRAAALAALGAVAAVAVHAFFDFGLSMPAVSATLAIVCGAALSVPLARVSPTGPPPAAP